MMENKTPKFIVIDDDNINNFLVKGVLNQLNPNSEIECFTDPELGLKQLITMKAEQFKNCVIFLDLNMPIINGWDVLDKLVECYGENLPENAKLYIASSSSIEKDISRSQAYKLVKGYLPKPLKIEILKQIANF